MSPRRGKKLSDHPIHLGVAADAHEEPLFSGEMQWYMEYAQRRAKDGDKGRLIALHEFSESWSSWEMHPAGHEIVICISGSLTLVQEHGNEARKTALGPDEYAMIAPGVWHTVDVNEATKVIFVTAGAGTQHRPR